MLSLCGLSMTISGLRGRSVLQQVLALRHSVAVAVGFAVGALGFLGAAVLAASSDGALPSELQPASGRAEIVINIPEFRLRYFVDRKVVLSTGIAVGRQVKQTKLGAYVIHNKAKFPTWFPEGKEPVPPGPENPLGSRWMGLDRDSYGLHGTIWPWSIGRAASSGCIRMTNEVVEKLYDMVAIGTPVRLAYVRTMTSGATAPDSAWVQVFADIYQKDGARMDNVPTGAVRKAMADTGMGQLLAEADESLLWDMLKVARGARVYIPYALSFSIDGAGQAVRGITYRGEQLVPVQQLATYMGVGLSFDTKTNTATLAGQRVSSPVVLAGKTYARPSEMTRILGVAFAYQPSLKAVSASTRTAARPGPTNSYLIRMGGRQLQGKAFIDDGGLMVPIRVVADALGIAVEFEKPGSFIYPLGNRSAGTTKMRVVDDKAYLALDEIERMLDVMVGVDEVDKAIDISRRSVPMDSPPGDLLIVPVMPATPGGRAPAPNPEAWRALASHYMAMSFCSRA